MRRRLQWRPPIPDPATFFFIGGAMCGGIWLYNVVTGHNTDGGFPGAMVGMWAVWSAIRRDNLRRDDRRFRRPPPTELESEPEQEQEEGSESRESHAQESEREET